MIRCGKSLKIPDDHLLIGHGVCIFRTVPPEHRGKPEPSSQRYADGRNAFLVSAEIVLGIRTKITAEKNSRVRHILRGLGKNHTAHI